MFETGYEDEDARNKALKLVLSLVLVIDNLIEVII